MILPLNYILEVIKKTGAYEAYLVQGSRAVMGVNIRRIVDNWYITDTGEKYSIFEYDLEETAEQLISNYNTLLCH